MRKSGLAILFVALLTSGCSNSCARSFGGTMTVTLEPGQKLLTCTWKQEEFWYLTRPMREGETAETYTFQEKSGVGMLEGSVVIQERR